MRFGLSDLGELPSLKEFEALAREALGSDEGVAVPDELPTDELDEVLDSPENAGTGIVSEPASDGAQHDREDPLDPFVETFASKQQGGNMPTDRIPSNQSDANEEIAAEVNATGEGMPAGEIDEAPQDPEAVQSPTAFDAENRRKNLAPTGKSTDKSGESKGAAAGE
jgi:hypothetical protein